MREYLGPAALLECSFPQRSQRTRVRSGWAQLRAAQFAVLKLENIHAGREATGHTRQHAIILRDAPQFDRIRLVCLRGHAREMGEQALLSFVGVSTQLGCATGLFLLHGFNQQRKLMSRREQRETRIVAQAAVNGPQIAEWIFVDGGYP